MPQTIEGTLSARGLRFAIVASRFNEALASPGKRFHTIYYIKY